MSATRGEHIHVRPKKGRMKKFDVVVGYPIVGYEFEDGRYQDTVIIVDGEKAILADFIDSIPSNMRVDTIPFPIYEDCCDMQYPEG